MNRVLAFVTAAVIATPLVAATTSKPISTTTDAAPAADSPLVAAAKKAGRLGKKPTNVITNESLAKSGGHVTTTQQQPAIAPSYTAPSQPVGQQAAAPAAPAHTAPANAAKEKQNEQQRQKTMQQVAAQYEGDAADVDHDPAQQEQQMKTLQAPPAPGDKKP